MENSMNAHDDMVLTEALFNSMLQDHRLLDAFPCAVYLVQDDPDLTLLYGNPLFYALFGCSAADMKLKYANRCSALVDSGIPQNMASSGSGEPCLPVKFRQHIRRSGGGAWIDTQALHIRYQGRPAFFCSSFDVTEDQLQLSAQGHKEQAVFLLAKQVKCDIFGYDSASGETHIYNTRDFLKPELLGACAAHPGFPRSIIDRNLVHPDDLAVFQDAFASVAQGEQRAVCELSMKIEADRYAWARMTLAALPAEPGRAAQIVGILENISEQKELSAQYLNETQFYQALLTEKTAFAQVDVTMDRCTRFGGMWNLYNEVKDVKTYSEIIHEFINKVVHPEDRKHYLELMQRDNFIQSLDNGIDRLGCEFRRIVEQNKMMWMELQVHLFRDPFTHHVLALLSITNIDAVKKQQLALLHQSAASPGRGGERPVLKLPFSTPDAENAPSFESFLAEQGDIAYLVDPENFNLICGNKAFYDRIGMTPSECAGVKCYEAMQRRTSPCPFCSKANWSTDKFYLWRNINTVLEQEFLIKNKLVSWDGAEALLAIAVDISNNKSIVDSMENGGTESHSILSGIQRMAEMSDLASATQSALETIGCFFRADAARFWTRSSTEAPYTCAGFWTKESQADYSEEDAGTWLREQAWNQQLSIESPEAMLCRSYTMYQYMKQHHIDNQRWVPLRDEGQVLGIIGIENISSNFQNAAFLESFLAYMAEEIKKRSLTEQALYSNEHDDLTDLLSRISFERYVQEHKGDQVSSVGVLVANVDSLADINSSQGFVAGNFCLKQLSNMLKSAFPEEPIFRLNGDEFLVIATDTDRLGLEAGVQRLKVMLEETGAFTASIGYSWDNVENNLALLIQQANEAMDVEKKRHHDANPISINDERRKMLHALMTALENREFEVFLQPKVELMHRKVIGAEALIRYRHKEQGLLTPDKFIDVLEKNNLIRYIDLFVFEESCRILEQWKQAGCSLPVISLNFSRLTLLERDILACMEQIVGKYSVPRSYIEIEITESVANMGKSILYQAALELYRAGFHISLDDFGTKYANLAILADIDFNMLKLDKSLVGNLTDQKNHQIILKNIICMCEDLGIDVIAEGVETKGQEGILRKLNCKLGQGYLYGKPMPVQEFFTRYLSGGAKSVGSKETLS